MSLKCSLSCNLGPNTARCFDDLVADVIGRLNFAMETSLEASSGIVRVRLFKLTMQVLGEQRIRKWLGHLQQVDVGGGTYKPFPAALQRKGACINIQNRDHRCFRYSIVCYLRGWLEERDSQRWPGRFFLEQRRGGPRGSGFYERIQSSDLDDTGLDFSMLDESLPVPLGAIDRFEEVNQLLVYVYEWLELPEDEGSDGAALVRACRLPPDDRSSSAA